MAITIELPEELERSLRAAAEAEGVEPEALVIQALEEKLQPLPPPWTAPEALTDDQLLRLIRRAAADAARTELLAELARRRGTSLAAVMEELGLSPDPLEL